MIHTKCYIGISDHIQYKLNICVYLHTSTIAHEHGQSYIFGALGATFFHVGSQNT